MKDRPWLEIFRETVVGHLLRWASGGKLLPWAEDKDPSSWKMYISIEKSKNLEQLLIEEKRRKEASKNKIQRRRKSAPAQATAWDNHAAHEKTADVAQHGESENNSTVVESKMESSTQPLETSEKQEAG